MQYMMVFVIIMEIKSMKKGVYLLFTLFLVGCSTYKLDKTIWTNASPVEKDGEKGVLVTSLYFVSDNSVDIYSSVWQDSTLLVSPFIFAKGNYTIEKGSSKETYLTIDALNVNDKKLTYEGVYFKEKGMYLLSSDSIIKVFGKVKNTKIE